MKSRDKEPARSGRERCFTPISAEKTKEFGTTIMSLRQELEKGGGLGRLRDVLIAESTLDYVLEKNK